MNKVYSTQVAFGNTFKTSTTNLLISARPYQPLPLLEGTLSVDTRWNNQPREHFESIPTQPPTLSSRARRVLSFNKLSNPRRRLGTAGKAATFCYRAATSLSLAPAPLRFPHASHWASAANQIVSYRTSALSIASHHRMVPIQPPLVLRI
ncbi:hypothetical protein CONLIGDRAFT_126508 [Coniochaeta ligniaria NRRL 30616]|uniref:Uncharacterized protein n=1 Tax=Coniochaeta ligniaria NRRL 30616 TaxID=1408157 RepID=A0A1J7J0L0_9PEZI|nr:hypothetical protein CONLIGDRAFT_126508 [Coniochaeta ligniaria NRRL 30616]